MQQEEHHVIFGEQLRDGGEFVGPDLGFGLLDAFLFVGLPELSDPAEAVRGEEGFVAILVGPIRRTTTTTGLKVTAREMPGAYPTGRKVTSAEYDAIRLTRHETCPQWNYTIHPRTGGKNTK